AMTRCGSYQQGRQMPVRHQKRPERGPEAIRAHARILVKIAPKGRGFESQPGCVTHHDSNCLTSLNISMLLPESASGAETASRGWSRRWAKAHTATGKFGSLASEPKNPRFRQCARLAFRQARLPHDPV